MKPKLTILLLALLVLCTILLTGCERGKVDNNKRRLNNVEDAILSAEYNGHKYIIYRSCQRGGITHDPDCPCHQKGGER